MYQNQNFNKMYQETVEKFGDKLESNTALLEKIWDGISKDWSGNKWQNQKFTPEKKRWFGNLLIPCWTKR